MENIFHTQYSKTSYDITIKQNSSVKCFNHKSIMVDENMTISPHIDIQISTKRKEFYRRTAVMIPAPISAPSSMKRRSNATTFLNDAFTCFFQTDDFSILCGLIKSENLSLPIICFPIL